jgi:hypothetical protein
MNDAGRDVQSMNSSLDANKGFHSNSRMTYVYKADRVNRQIRCSVRKIRYSDTCCKNGINLISQKTNGRELDFYSDGKQVFFSRRIWNELWRQYVPSLYMLYLRNYWVDLYKIWYCGLKFNSRENPDVCSYVPHTSLI